jgi:hypothetical protein
MIVRDANQPMTVLVRTSATRSKWEADDLDAVTVYREFDREPHGGNVGLLQGVHAAGSRCFGRIGGREHVKAKF